MIVVFPFSADRFYLTETGDSWSSFFWPRDWEILIMEALLHVPANEEKEQTFRITLSDNLPNSSGEACTLGCKTQESAGPEKSEN